jgi:hypothetical protein
MGHSNASWFFLTSRMKGNAAIALMTIRLSSPARYGRGRKTSINKNNRRFVVIALWPTPQVTPKSIPSFPIQKAIAVWSKATVTAMSAVQGFRAINWRTSGCALMMARVRTGCG